MNEVRKCKCGTILSRYNHDDECSLCKERPALPSLEIRQVNRTGFRGVYHCGTKFKAQRQVNGHKRHLGMFDTAELASARYEEEIRKERIKGWGK